MLDKIEDALNGKYSGLYGEIIGRDTYRLRNLPDVVSINDPKEVHDKGHKRGFDFIPDIFIDCGANIGVTSRYVRSLFPKCIIISIEPNPSNISVFKQFTKDDKIILIEKAIGKGTIFHGLTASNGSGETYLSGNVLGYSESEMINTPTLEVCDVETIRLSEIFKQYVKKGDKVIIKIDIEGSENSIWEDGESMECLRTADYICAEIHRYSLTHRDWQEVQDKTDEVLQSFSDTHDLIFEHVNFYATKKK